jgi:uncharacterized protein YbcI
MTDQTAPSDPTADPIDDPIVAGLISKRVVQLLNEHIGRGATKVRTYVSEDLVTVVLREVLTKAERNLADAGKEEPVLDGRRAQQDTMEEALKAIVEELTGRRVVAFLSANHIDPDIEIESFVLER